MRTLVLGDLHLSTHTPQAVAHDLVALLAAHRGARIIFAGDFFDLSADPGTTVAHGFEAHPHVRRALDEHVAHGGRVVWLSGNHDHSVANDVEAGDHTQVTPWFFREGALH